RKIVESAATTGGDDAQRIGDYYKSFMDEAAIEQQGIAPLQPKLDAIAKIKDAKGVVLAFANASRELGNTPIRTRVELDDREPEQYIANLRQGGLGLPDRDMYDVKAKQFAAQREGYKKYIAAMFALLGWKDADQRAGAVYALEEKLAAAHWTRVQN